MTPGDLIAEGEALVKRGFALSTKGEGALAGYWGGHSPMSRASIARLHFT